MKDSEWNHEKQHITTLPQTPKKIKAMFNDHQKPIKQAGPATPAEILGLSGVPEAGEIFYSVESEKIHLVLEAARFLERLEHALDTRRIPFELVPDYVFEQTPGHRRCEEERGRSHCVG